MPRIKDLQNYTGALNRADIFFAVDGNSFSRGMSMSGQQVHTLCKGIDGKSIELRSNSTHIQWRWEGDSIWANLIAISSLKGEDGKELEIRVQSGYIQTRLIGETWSNLIDLNAALPAFTFETEKGNPGTNPDVSVTGSYPDLNLKFKIPEGVRGEQGKSLVVLPNGNYGNWDEMTADYVDSGVQASASVNIEQASVSFAEATSRENLNPGEKVPVLFGKLRKWFSDFGPLAWKTQVDYVADINNAINVHDTSDTSHFDIRNSLTSFQQNALTALRVHEGAGIKVTVETNGDVTLSAEIDNEIFITVLSLPETGIENKIYLAPKSEGRTEDALDEYIWINNGWELVGSISVDLTNYYTKAEATDVINAAIEAHNNDTNAHSMLKAESLIITLQAEKWTQEEEKWKYRYELSDLKDTGIVWLTPSNDFEVDYTDAGVYSLGETQNGYFEIYARNQPIEDLTVGISIIN